MFSLVSSAPLKFSKKRKEKKIVSKHLNIIKAIKEQIIPNY